MTESLPVLNQSRSVTYRDMVQVPCAAFLVFAFRILDGIGMDKTFPAIRTRFTYDKSQKTDSVHGRRDKRHWIKNSNECRIWDQSVNQKPQVTPKESSRESVEVDYFNI